ncbi:MAG: NADH-ubiquinone dehydrogenase [Pararhizobium sp.]
MSMFSFPDAMTPDKLMKSMPDATRWMTEPSALPMPALMLHPIAASAAVTAVGLGMASHMSGLFLGALEGTLGMSRRLGLPIADGVAEMAFGSAVSGASGADVAQGRPAAGPGRPAAEALKTSSGKTSTVASGAVAELKSAAETAADAVTESTDASVAAAGKAAAGELQPETFRRPREMAKPAKPDDLKLISGIGPKLEQVLNGLGIWTFAQIEALDAAEAAWLDDYLQFRGRIERDGWQRQAASFVKGTS